METKTYGIFSNAANRKIINNLETNGAKVFQFPPLETELIENAEIIYHLSDFEWLIFADVFAVDYFLEILEANSFDLFELDEKRILVFGEAIADRLRFSQIHADVIPNSVESDDVFSAISEYLSAEELASARFLMPKFVGFETDLKERLTEIKELEIYRIKVKTDKETARLKAFLVGGAIDSFVFSAPEDVFFLRQFLFPNILREVLADLEIFGTNEITMQTLRENGLPSMFFSRN